MVLQIFNLSMGSVCKDAQGFPCRTKFLLFIDLLTDCLDAQGFLLQD